MKAVCGKWQSGLVGSLMFLGVMAWTAESWGQEQEQVPDRVKQLRQSAQKYQESGAAQQAEGAYRTIVTDYAQTKYEVESRGDIVRMKIKNGDKAGADSEYQKLQGEKADECRAGEIYSIAQVYKESGDKEQAMRLHKYNVTSSPVSVGSLGSQGEIIQDAFDKKDLAAVEAELGILRDKFSGTQGVAKELYNAAQRYQKEGKREDAVKWHRYNISKYPDTFEGTVSQLEIVYDAFDRKDFAGVDKEAKFLTENFGKKQGLAYGIYMIGNRYKDAGYRDKALQMYKLSVTNASDLGGMLSQVEIVKDKFEKKDYVAVETEMTFLKDVFAETDGISRELYQIAQRYKAEGRRDEAIKWHRYNVDQYSDKFDGTVSQLDIVYDAFDRKDYESVDKEVRYLLDNFGKRPGLAYGMYEIGKRYKAAGMPGKGNNLFKAAMDNAVDLGSMFAQVEIVNDALAAKDYVEAEEQSNILYEKYKGVSGISRELYLLGCKFSEAGKTDLAIRYHRLNTQEFYGTTDAMQSQFELVRNNLLNGGEGQAEIEAEELVKGYGGKKYLYFEIMHADEAFKKSGVTGSRDMLMERLLGELDEKIQSNNRTVQLISMADKASVFIYKGDHKRVKDLVDDMLPDTTIKVEEKVAIEKEVSQHIFQVADVYYNRSLELQRDKSDKKVVQDYFANSVDILEKAVELSGMSTENLYMIYYMQGECYNRLGNIEKAAACFEKHIAIEGTYGSNMLLGAYLRLPELYAAMCAKGIITKEQQIAKSVACLNKLRAVCKTDERMYKNATNMIYFLYINNKNWQEAIVVCEGYISTFGNKDDGMMLYNLGLAFVGLENKEKAKVVFKDCVDNSNDKMIVEMAKVQLELLSK